MKFPSLYKSLQKGRELSTKSFLWWFWKSLFQASVIMLSSIYFFEHSYLKIATITFTALIMAELLNVYTEVKLINFRSKNSIV
jgi:phospholipid-translocating ATPase